jgi:hypothetical protein
MRSASRASRLSTSGVISPSAGNRRGTSANKAAHHATTNAFSHRVSYRRAEKRSTLHAFLERKRQVFGLPFDLRRLQITAG